MIDINSETLLTPAEIARHPAFKRAGKPVHISTVWRWLNVGCRAVTGDRVRLETIRLPAGTFSSREAVNRFIAALNGLDIAEMPSVARQRQISTAERELAAAGIV